MDYRWNVIRQQIIRNCKKTFAEETISISESDIENAVDLFDRVISYPVNFHSVSSLEKDIKLALQRSYIENIGSSSDVRSLLNILDAFLKKTLLLVGEKNETQLSDRNITLKPLLSFASVSSTFSAINHRIEEGNIAVYHTDLTGAYILCKTYLYRNKCTHECPDWDSEDVLHILRYTVSTYILVVHSMKVRLISCCPKLKIQHSINLKDYSDSGYLYDFMNFGKSTNQIKNQIIESFILHQVYLSTTSLCKDICEGVLSFSHSSLSERSVNRIMEKMIPHKIEYIDAHKKSIKLTDEERNRIKNILDEYYSDLTRFNADLSNVLDEFGILGQSEAVIQRLKILFEHNCDDIISEEVPADANDFNEGTKDFLKYLNDIGCDSKKTTDLFKRIMDVCRLNDILVRISLGIKFSSLSNPDAFSSELKERDRFVYIDTQIILYALCIYPDFHSFDNNPYYVIVKNLIEISRHNEHIHLIATSQYINEAAYHLKRALQLITYDDIYKDSRLRLSNNVFYSYYYYLKDNGFLNEGIDCFADFLYELFNVEFDEILNKGFESSITPELSKILLDDFGISTETISHYSDKEISESENLFSLSINEDNRHPIAIHKDAIMGLVLFDTEKNRENEPIFLSWDKAFVSYRKSFKEKYRKHSVFSWLLFSPGRFVNHMDLYDPDSSEQCNKGVRL